MINLKHNTQKSTRLMKKINFNKIKCEINLCYDFVFVKNNNKMSKFQIDIYNITKTMRVLRTNNKKENIITFLYEIFFK